jgi:hypothetical protein
MFYPGTSNDETAKLLREGMLTGAWIIVQSGSERVKKRYLYKILHQKPFLNREEILHIRGSLRQIWF